MQFRGALVTSKKKFSQMPALQMQAVVGSPLPGPASARGLSAGPLCCSCGSGRLWSSSTLQRLVAQGHPGCWERKEMAQLSDSQMSLQGSQ